MFRKKDVFKALPFLIIFGATTLAALANVAVQFVLARTLGPNQFGAFCSSLAIVTLIAPLAAFGVGSWWLRVFGEEGYAAQRWVKPSIKFSALTSLAVITLLISWAFLGPHDSLIGPLTALLTGVVFSQVIIDLVSAKFQLEANHVGLAAWTMISHPLRLVGLLLLVFHVPLLSLFHVAFLYLTISILITLIGCFYLAGFYNGNLRLAEHQKSTHFVKIEGYLEEPTLKAILVRTSPFGLESFFFLVYYQTDLILLSYLSNKEAVGFYGVSVGFIAAACLLPSVLYQKFLLPKIHRWSYKEDDQFKAFIRRGGILLCLAGLLVTLVILYGASYLVPLFLGEEYRPSIPLLILMSLAIPFRYVAVHLGSILCTRELIWVNLKITGFTALLNVFLNLLLIPQYGGSGAAVATIVSYVFLAVLFATAVRKHF
jgi:O-antigen/teichoic acid export membrane protein